MKRKTASLRYRVIRALVSRKHTLSHTPTRTSKACSVKFTRLIVQFISRTVISIKLDTWMTTYCVKSTRILRGLPRTVDFSLYFSFILLTKQVLLVEWCSQHKPSRFDFYRIGTSEPGAFVISETKQHETRCEHIGELSARCCRSCACLRPRKARVCCHFGRTERRFFADYSSARWETPRLLSLGASSAGGSVLSLNDIRS